MSRLVISGGLVCDPMSKLERTGQVLIQEGRIFGIANEVPTDWAAARVIDATDKLVIPGLVCLRTHVCEPGEEWKEDVASARNAAAAGGFTTICATPDTVPTNDVRAVTEQIVTRSASSAGPRVLPVGAATMGLRGEHLTEMGDLRDAGCVAVSTGEGAVPNGSLMRRVLEYARSVGLPVFASCLEPSLTKDTVMHEGSVHLRLGMAAEPAESESIALFRDGTLAQLARWPIHAQRISTAAGVAVLRQLRDSGVPITADVTPHHLWFTDELITSFDTNTLVKPPLRSPADVAALRVAVADGVIDAVATDHSPQSSIEKLVEYRYAQPGTTGLETALPVLLELVRTGVLDRMSALEKLTVGPARILGRDDLGRLSEGALADVVIVDPATPHRIDSRTMSSRSRNCIFDGVSVTGAVETTIVGGQVVHGAEADHADR